MYLKSNFNLIKDAIVESWTSKEGIELNELTYDNTNQEIFGIITYHGSEYEFHYKEKDHAKATEEESLDSFLDDLNTDLVLADIFYQYPHTGIVEASWGSRYVELEHDIVLTTFDKFYSPKTGIFNFDEFFAEKRKASEKANPESALRSFGSRGLMPALPDDSNYPHTFESKLIIKPETLKLHTSKASLS